MHQNLVPVRASLEIYSGKVVQTRHGLAWLERSEVFVSVIPSRSPLRCEHKTASEAISAIMLRFQISSQ